MFSIYWKGVRRCPAPPQDAEEDLGQGVEGVHRGERAAMRVRARELKAAASREEAEKACFEATTKMPKPDRDLGRRVHDLIKAIAPELAPKTWHGMPAYAKDDRVVCFFQSADKFKARYATLGFNDAANLDKGAMWATSFALKEWTPAVEKEVTRLVKRAVS